MKTGIKVAVGVGAVLAAYFGWKKFKPETKLTRKEKYLKDAMTPGTSLNNEFTSYLASTNKNYTPQDLQSVILYHGEDIPGRRFNQFYNKTFYSPSEVVRY